MTQLSKIPLGARNGYIRLVRARKVGDVEK
jgi:hypothetical protein